MRHVYVSRLTMVIGALIVGACVVFAAVQN
jgi:hypothetical protein